MNAAPLAITDRRRVILGPTGNVVRHVREQPLEAVSLAGSFQGTDTGSRDRGYVYIPTLDTTKEVDAWSHTELLKRSRFIFNSGGGMIRRGTLGIARMVCGTGLFPYPLARNKAWGKKLRQLWASRCESKNTFDLSRKHTCGSAQRAIITNKIKDGDMAPVLARDENDRLRLMFYEAHQIGQGSTRVDPSQTWHHGVRLNQHRAPIAYRVLSSDLTTGKQTSVDIPAENVLFVADYERFGQVRGLTRYYSVVNKVLDRGEIMHALTKGIKMREQVGWAIEQQMVVQSMQPGGLGSLAPMPSKLVDVGGGKKISLQEFFGGGESWQMQPGQSFKVIESDHPNENVREHLETLVRDWAWAMGYAPELLWNITQLGGANTRFVMADAQSQIDVEQQDMVEQFLGPWYIAWVRDMIEAGEIEEDPDWMLHSWLLPKRLTVDFGRDGKLHIEQAKRGMITMKALYGFVGDEWQAEIDQYLDERQYIKDGLTANGRNLTWAEAFPEIGTGTTAAQEQAEEDPDKEETAITRAIENKPFRL